MEVRFRNLRPSTLTRLVTPNRPPSESDQSFLEIVESVTGTESTPEKNPNSGHDRQSAPQEAHTTKADSPPNEETIEAGIWT